MIERCMISTPRRPLPSTDSRKPLLFQSLSSFICGSTIFLWPPASSLHPPGLSTWRAGWAARPELACGRAGTPGIHRRPAEFTKSVTLLNNRIYGL